MLNSKARQGRFSVLASVIFCRKPLFLSDCSRVFRRNGRNHKPLRDSEKLPFGRRNSLRVDVVARRWSETRIRLPHFALYCCRTWRNKRFGWLAISHGNIQGNSNATTTVRWRKPSMHSFTNVVRSVTFIRIYLLTPCNRGLPEKPTSPQVVRKFPAFYGTRRFITAFTKADHVPLSWATSIQSMPSQATSRRSILILSFHIWLNHPSGFLPSVFPTKSMYTLFLSPYVLHAHEHISVFLIWSPD